MQKEFPEAEVFETKKVELKNPIIFAGFVGAGLVGPVAINHIIEKLKMSIHYSMWEWEKSQNLSHELGFERSSVLEYDKVTLISIPIDNSNLFVGSIQPKEDYFKMISKIKPIIENFIKE